MIAPHDFSAIPNGTTFTARFCDDSGEHRFERDKDGVFWFAGETERVDGPDWFGHAGYCEWRTASRPCTRTEKSTQARK